MDQMGMSLRPFKSMSLRPFLVAILLSLQPVHADDLMPTGMVIIPEGWFTMGDDWGPMDERPAHQVWVDAYQIERTPVTNAQFAAFLNVAGAVNADRQRLYDVDDRDTRIHLLGQNWVAGAGFEQHPVVEPSWFGARDYCLGIGRRLPTEAEWEKAARGHDGRRYPWGNDPPDKTRARFNVGWNETTAVGSYPAGASPYGVLDMAGNVWEWVSSVYAP